MIAEYLRKTRENAGILIGIRQETPVSALDSLAEELTNFYSERNYIVIKNKKYGSRQQKRDYYDVFTGLPDINIEYIKDKSGNVIDQRVLTGKEPLFMRVKLEHLNQRIKHDYWDRYADYAQTPLVIRTQDCRLYFNAPLKPGAERNAREQWERSAFLEYLKNATRTTKI